LAPYLVTVGAKAWIASALMSFCALFSVGAVLSIFTARGPIRSGARMVGIGLLVSAITYSVGWLFGVSLAG
jgi:VIT1/CCC1 family predicted Fe2+/Mn2+ transporter